MTDVRFLTEWIVDGPNASAEERATLCDLQIFVDDKNLCIHSDPSSSEPFDHLTIPAIHIAEGLATDWWSIFGGRDRHHSILPYRMGFAIPKLRFTFDGSMFEVVGSKYSYENPNLQFLQAARESLPGESAESVLADYIVRVLGRLAGEEVPESEVAVRWSRVARSRSDPDERAFCEAAGALGIDPYLISDDDVRFIEHASNLFDGEALIEFLAGIRQQEGTRSRQLLAWVRESGARLGDTSRLPDLTAIAEQIGAMVAPNPGERSWALGYRAARAVRAVITTDRGERLTSTEAIAAKLDAANFAPVPGSAGALAVVSRDAEQVHVHLRRHLKSQLHLQNFAFARAIGDAICFRDTPLSVVNRLHRAHRQATGRAFAAEFLAPVDSVLDMVEDGRDPIEIAQSFNVSRRVVLLQIWNQDRIRQSCAALAA